MVGRIYYCGVHEMIWLKDIPDDLSEMLYEDDIMYTGSTTFDKAMIENEFFNYGSIRRSHRVITKKAKDAGYFGIVETLTGLTEEDVRSIWADEVNERDYNTLIELAERYGYDLVKR